MIPHKGRRKKMASSWGCEGLFLGVFNWHLVCLNFTIWSVDPKTHWTLVFWCIWDDFDVFWEMHSAIRMCCIITKNCWWFTCRWWFRIRRSPPIRYIKRIVHGGINYWFVSEPSTDTYMCWCIKRTIRVGIANVSKQKNSPQTLFRFSDPQIKHLNIGLFLLDGKVGKLPSWMRYGRRSGVVVHDFLIPRIGEFSQRDQAPLTFDAAKL